MSPRQTIAAELAFGLPAADQPEAMPAGLPSFAKSMVQLLVVSSCIAIALAAASRFGVLDIGRLVRLLGALDARRLAIVLALALTSNLLRVWRWHLMTLRIAPHVPIAASFAYVVTGFAFLMTPGKIGEVVRIWLLKNRQNVPYTDSLAILVRDRLTDMASLMLLANCGMFGGSSHPGLVAGVLAALSLLLVGLSSRRLIVTIAVIGHRYTGRRFRSFFRFALLVDRTLRRVADRRMLIVTMVLGVVAWGTQIAGIGIVLDAYGFRGGLMQVAVLYPTALLIGGVTVVPGGPDAVMLGMLVASGMGAEAAVAATLASRVLTWWLSMMVGWCVAPFVLANPTTLRAARPA